MLNLKRFLPKVVEIARRGGPPEDQVLAYMRFHRRLAKKYLGRNWHDILELDYASDIVRIKRWVTSLLVLDQPPPKTCILLFEPAFPTSGCDLKVLGLNNPVDFAFEDFEFSYFPSDYFAK